MGCYANTGPRGVPGQDGASADVQIGTTTTGAPGTNAEVIDSGANNVAILNFIIPRGIKVNLVLVLTSLVTSMNLVRLVLTVQEQVTLLLTAKGMVGSGRQIPIQQAG